MNNVSLKPFTLNSKHCIDIKFPYNFKVKKQLKKFNDVRWPKTNNTFYIYFNEVRLEDLKPYLAKGNLNITSQKKYKFISRISKGVKIELKVSLLTATKLK